MEESILQVDAGEEVAGPEERRNEVEAFHLEPRAGYVLVEGFQIRHLAELAWGRLRDRELRRIEHPALG